MSVKNKALMTNAALLYGCAYGLDETCSTMACEDGPVLCLTTDQILIVRNCVGRGWYTRLQDGNLLTARRAISVPHGIECTHSRIDAEYESIKMVSSCVADILADPKVGIKRPFPGASNKVSALEELTDILPMLATINQSTALQARTVETLARLLVRDSSGKYAEMLLSSLVRRAIEEYKEGGTFTDTMAWEQVLFGRVNLILNDGESGAFDNAYRANIDAFANFIEIRSSNAASLGFNKACFQRIPGIARRRIEEISNTNQSEPPALLGAGDQVPEVSCSWLHVLYVALLRMGKCSPGEDLESFASRRFSECEDHDGFRTVLELVRSMVADERLAPTKGGDLVTARLDALGKFMSAKDNVDDDEEIDCLKAAWASL